MHQIVIENLTVNVNFPEAAPTENFAWLDPDDGFQGKITGNEALEQPKFSDEMTLGPIDYNEGQTADELDELEAVFSLETHVRVLASVIEDLFPAEASAFDFDDDPSLAVYVAANLIGRLYRLEH